MSEYIPGLLESSQCVIYMCCCVCIVTGGDGYQMALPESVFECLRTRLGSIISPT